MLPCCLGGAAWRTEATTPQPGAQPCRRGKGCVFPGTQSGFTSPGTLHTSVCHSSRLLSGVGAVWHVQDLPAKGRLSQKHVWFVLFIIAQLQLHMTSGILTLHMPNQLASCPKGMGPEVYHKVSVLSGPSTQARMYVATWKQSLIREGLKASQGEFLQIV